jgi:hypothetical protein
MEAFFMPRRKRHSEYWVNWLVFDPKRPFSEAAVKIQERRDELDRSRWGSR